MGNGGCQHKCKDGKNEPECNCVKGYFLGEDKKKCIGKESNSSQKLDSRSSHVESTGSP